MSSTVVLLLMTLSLSLARVHPRSNMVCINGEMNQGRCECTGEYVGRHCEKKKMCDSNRRHHNGTCLSCMNGYAGEYCENIQCGDHGTLDKRETGCICSTPFSGPFCAELDTKNIYSYYNNKVYSLGPLGVVALIPMCLMLIGCERMARKRQIARVQKSLEDQKIEVPNDMVVHLLSGKKEEGEPEPVDV